ncbi:MAG: hypothetical protein ACK5D5_07510 [Bacteroidota bacterium]|jgi:hypothetical protein
MKQALTEWEEIGFMAAFFDERKIPRKRGKNFTKPRFFGSF